MRLLRSPLPLFLFAVSLWFASAAAAQQRVVDQLEFQPIETGLNRPTSIVSPNDGSGRLFVTEQPGLVRILEDGVLLPLAFLNITQLVESRGFEQGLFDIAFHPQYRLNGIFFVHYSSNSGDTAVARYRVSENPNRADPSSGEVILRAEQPFSNHNGGEIEFGPDGYLYIGLGDGGSGGDPRGNGQSLGTMLGKILRIDVDGGNPYLIPSDNPFVGRAGARGEIYAYGLRNPWRFSFDRVSNDLFVGDVGQGRFEEISVSPGGSGGGQNFGWNIMEGFACNSPQVGCNSANLTLPIVDYPHTGGGCGGSVSGGYSYRGPSAPQLHGVYFFADYCSGSLYAAVPQAAGGWALEGPRAVSLSISTFGEDENGELYFADHGGGTIYRASLPHPFPSITSVAPSAAEAGGPAFSLTVIGENFIPSSTVRWNGSQRPTTFVDNLRLTASINAADIAGAGQARITVTNPLPGGGTTTPLDFEVNGEPTLSPLINPQGIVDAAAFRAIPLAAGSIATVFGTDLAVRDEVAGEVPLPTLLGGGMLRAQNVLPPGVLQAAPILLVNSPFFFASPLQSNIQIPWEIGAWRKGSLTAVVGEQESAAVEFELAEFSPSVFSLDQSGAGQAAAVINGTAGFVAAPPGLTPSSRPIAAGETLLIFATGLGTVTNRPATGAPALSDPLSETTTLPVVRIGGTPVPVTFSGLAPSFVGLYQVNAEITAAVPGGPTQPLLLSIGGVEANAVSIAVE